MPAQALNTEGFTLVGYATSPLGLGEDLRAFAAMLEHLQIPFSVIDLPTESQGQVHNHWQFQRKEAFATFIYFMSPMTCQQLMRYQPELFQAPSLRIGYFLWELPDFPDAFLPALERMDQIWCPTRFVQQSFFQRVKKLTLALPLPVLHTAGQGLDYRKQLGIPAHAFVALYLFDVHSTLNRKNPQAVVQAFRQFARHQRNAHLVLKVNRLQNAPKHALDWLPSHPRIHLITEPLEPAQLSDLYSSADCYLSLHRSEGFGRTLVEAMQHGLELICSDFSGPQDFVHADNAHVVSWARQEVNRGDYPHTQGSWWADPSPQHAAELLKQARLRRQSGPNPAALKTAEGFTPQALAARYRPILQAIQTDAARRISSAKPSAKVVRT